MKGASNHLAFKKLTSFIKKRIVIKMRIIVCLFVCLFVIPMIIKYSLFKTNKLYEEEEKNKNDQKLSFKSSIVFLLS